MNNSQREHLIFNVHIKDETEADTFMKKYQQFVWLNRMGILLLYINYSMYGKLNVKQRREFNELGKQSFLTIPEYAFSTKSKRINKLKINRKHDSKPKPKKPKHSPRKPIIHYQQVTYTELQWNGMEKDINEQIMLNIFDTTTHYVEQKQYTQSPRSFGKKRVTTIRV